MRERVGRKMGSERHSDVVEAGTVSMQGLCPILLALAFLTAIVGCASYQPFTQQLSWELNAPTYNNPVLVESPQPDVLWETICAVVALHQFDIVEDTPIRRYDNILTEGRLEAGPKIGASIAEPWHSDSVTFMKRMECTFQTIRRRIVVRALPEGNDFLVEVIVYEELEALPSPVMASSSQASLQYHNSPESRPDGTPETFTTIKTNIGRHPDQNGWIVVGRDHDFERRVLAEILFRLQRPPIHLRDATAPRRG